MFMNNDWRSNRPGQFPGIGKQENSRYGLEQKSVMEDLVEKKMNGSQRMRQNRNPQRSSGYLRPVIP
jgi:hypothetical protein